MHLLRDLPGVLLDGLKVLRVDVLRRKDACGVAGVDAGQLDVLHDRRHICVGSVADGVRLALQCVVQEAVDEDRAVRGDAHRRVHVARHGIVVVDDFHAAAAEHVGRTDHDRITDAVRDLLRLFDGGGHAGFRHRDTELVHDHAELVAVLRQVDDLGGGAQDLHAVLLELGSKVQRGLAAELGDDAHRLFLIVDGEDVLQGQGLEVELVGGVVVGGDRLRVAVDDDGLEAQLLQGLCRVDAAVVELNTLADAVRAAAEDHDLRLVRADLVVVRRVVGGVVVGAVLGAADMDRVPGLLDAQGKAACADLVLGDVQDLAQILVCEAVLLGLDELLVGDSIARGDQGFFFLNQLQHLLKEVLLDLRDLEELVHGHALPQCLIHEEVALGGGVGEQLQQLFLRELVEILDVAQSVAALLQGADGLLEGFLVVLADGHDLAHRAHLCAELIVHALELFEGPAGKLDDDVVAVRDVLVEGAVLSAGQLLQGQARGQLRGDQSDREAGGLGCQSGGAGGTGVDLDDDNAAGDRVMGELDVGAADDADVLDDPVGLALQLRLEILVDGQHRRGAEGVAGVDADGVDVLDEADGDHVVVLVADHLQLQLLPAEDGLLDEDLVDEGSLQAAGHDHFELFLVVDQSAAGAAHGVGGAEDHREAQLLGDGKAFLDAVGDFGAGHLDAQAVHGLLELNTVFAAFNGVDLDADDLDVVLVQDAFLVQLGGEVQSGLSAQVREQGVGTLFRDDLLKTGDVQRLDIGDVCHLRVRHDGRGVRVDQDDLISEAPEGLAGLGAGIVKFAGLPDDDGAGPDDQYLVDICSLRHCDLLTCLPSNNCSERL